MKTIANNRLVTPVENGSNGVQVVIPRMKISTIELRCIGVSPLMVLAFSEKAKAQMLAKQMGKASAGKTAKDPLALFKEAPYKDDEGFLMPSVCFKGAAVACANDIDQKQTEMRRAFHVLGEFVRIEAPPLKKPLSKWDEIHKKELKWYHERGCSMHEGIVRNATGVCDIRFRAFFPEWAVTLRIEYNEAIISREQLVMLYTAAGFGNGVGEWRPGSKESKTGTYGRWKLEGQ